MEYRQLGKSGVRLSVIGIGTNRFGSEMLPQDAVNSIIDAAIDHGINHIDTSDSYRAGRSEETLGVALKGRWDKFVVASKFWFPTGEGTNDRGASRCHLLNALESSLRRLQSDHVDLYYIHRWDEFTPIEETLRTLDDQLRAGSGMWSGRFCPTAAPTTSALCPISRWQAAFSPASTSGVRRLRQGRGLQPATIWTST